MIATLQRAGESWEPIPAPLICLYVLLHARKMQVLSAKATMVVMSEGVDGPLGGMLGVMSANVGMVERIACGFCVHCEGVGRILVLPVLDHGVDGINKAMLWD